jgi:hypothetical protein
MLVSREEINYWQFAHVPGAPADSDFSWRNNNVFPVVSHDGKTIAFSDQGAGSSFNYTVRVRHDDGRFAAIGEGVPQAFSPDDRWLFSLRGYGDTSFTIYPVAAGQPRLVDGIRMERAFSCAGELPAHDSAFVTHSTLPPRWL